MEKDIVAGGQELAEARSHLNKTSASVEELKSAVQAKQKELKSIESKIAEETKMLTAFKDELDALDRAIKAKRQEIADGELAIKELELEIARVKKDQKTAVDAVAKLEKQHSWISDECQCVAAGLASSCGANLPSQDLRQGGLALQFCWRPDGRDEEEMPATRGGSAEHEEEGQSQGSLDD